METIDKWIKSFTEAGHLWGIVFVTLMAGIGFIFGILNMLMWFVENTGEVPAFILWILQGFDLMIYAGGLILGIKFLLIIIRTIRKRR